MNTRLLLLITITLLLLSLARTFSGQVVAGGDRCTMSTLPCTPTSTPTFITIVITDTPTATPTVTPTPSSTPTTTFETVQALPTASADPVRNALFIPMVGK